MCTTISIYHKVVVLGIKSNASCIILFLWICKMAQWEKVHSAKPDNLSLIPRVPMVEGEDWLLKVALWSLRVCCGTYVNPHTFNNIILKIQAVTNYIPKRYLEQLTPYQMLLQCDADSLALHFPILLTYMDSYNFWKTEWSDPMWLPS